MNNLRTNRIRIIFISAAALLLVLSVFSYLRVSSLLATSQLVNHTTQVKLELENIYTSVSEADSGHRGFILTRDSTFLDKFNRTLLLLDVQLDSLEAHISDNYSQQQNLLQLRKIVTRRVNFMHSLVAQSETKKIAVEQWLEAREIMGELRLLVSHMNTEEDMLLKLRRRSLDEEILITPLFTVFLTVAALLILIASYFMVNRELHTSNELRDDLERSQAMLKDRNATLEDRNHSLALVNKELESFTYISSHDLQEPLRKMQTFISRIIDKDEATLSETGRNYLQRTQDAARRLQSLIQDLLAYSRVNKEIFPSEEVDLRSLVRQVKEELAEEIAAKDALITVSGEQNINIIPSQFRQLLLNLISNAIKFTAAGVRPEITIDNRTVTDGVPAAANLPKGKYSRISVSDNGIGFDMAYKERIFEVFQRLHTKDEFSGTGIGLAIVKKIVENHGGYITAKSEKNQGAEFVIYIPA